MSERDINRWHDAVTPFDKAPKPWTIGSGGSWDMLPVQPIPDAMLAELAQRYHYAGTPWNCRSMPLSDGDREYMYLLYSSMQGLVARMRAEEKKVAELVVALQPFVTRNSSEDTVKLSVLTADVTRARAAIAAATGARP